MVMESNNQYAPPRSNVADVPASGGALVLAGRGLRLGAAIIDGLLVSLPLLPTYTTAFVSTFRGAASGNGGSHTAVDFWTAVADTGGKGLFAGSLLVLAILLVNAVLVHRNGQTIAKKLLGIKVVRADGSRATLARIFWLRNVVNGLLGAIPIIGGLYALVDTLMIFGAARRCCHDYIANTVVVRA